MSEENALDLFANASPWSNQRILEVMNIAFQNMLTNQSPRVAQPSAIKLALKPHQLALIHGMVKKEKECMEGYSFQGTTTFTNYGILGEDVGTGKSLVVLGFIALKKEAEKEPLIRNTLYRNSSSRIFTIQNYTYKSPKGVNLIVVPHTIFKQWEQYCKQQTTLKVFYAKTLKSITPPNKEEEKEEYDTFVKNITESDIVLVSNTLYAVTQNIATDIGLSWLRIFVDEADSIHIPGTNAPLNGIFSWFITATWPNLILEGITVRPSTLLTLQENTTTYSPHVEQWLQREMGIQQGTNNYGIGKYVHYRVRSSNWLREYHTSHILRGHMVLHSTPEFLQESEQMPPIYHQTILCEQSISHRVVRGIVTAEVQGMLDAGNVEGALEGLGVCVDSSIGIVEAVTGERKKELKRLQKTLEFKQTMEYATPQAKENAIASLVSKIASVEEQLKTIRSRLGDSNTTEECPICYEIAKENNCTITPCCHRMFCGKCILTSLTRTAACPMCRTPIVANQLIHMKETSVKKIKKEEAKLLSKNKQLLKFLKENPTARVLIFSRYENPFSSLGNAFEEEGISHHILRGNKDVVASTIRSFEKGEKRVLFLPTEVAGAGINLVSATHVVLLHAMTPDEEKQVVGRAYRLGRKDPLNIIHLLHEEEKPL